MNLTAWVDVAIGTSVVYLGVSLFVTIVNEYIGQLFNLRGRQLAAAVEALIDDPNLRKELQKFPAFGTLFDGRPSAAPSYVDPVVLARLLLGLVPLDASVADVRERWVKAIETKLDPTSTLRTQLIGIVNVTADKTADFTQAVSEWADRSLTMLGEGYKKNIQILSLAVGFTIALAFNIDTVALTSHLYQDKEAREQAAQLGEQIAQSTNKTQFDQCLALPADKRRETDSCKPMLGLVQAVQSRNASLGRLPIGWDPANCPALDHTILVKLLGWVLTALAVSLGAPFWFDLLNRFVSVRYGMSKPDPGDGKA